MKKNSSWFRHDMTASDDSRMLELFEQCGPAGVGAYWMTIETLYKNEGYLSSSAMNAICQRNGYPLDFLVVVEKTGLLKRLNNDQWYSQRLNEELINKEKKSKVGRKHAMKRWRNKAKLQGMGTHRVPNANPMLGEERRGDSYRVTIATGVAREFGLLKKLPNHMMPIAIFALAVGLKFDNEKQLNAFIHRNLRPASRLQEYTPEQILKGYAAGYKESKRLGYNVTLETIGKKIDLYKNQDLPPEYQETCNQILETFHSQKDILLSKSSPLICQPAMTSN